MQIGLLGKANVGKSTFFSAATMTQVPSGNFPFTTIQPNVGVAYVTAECACRHFAISHENEMCRMGTRLIPVRIIDVAGLVPGAHEGKGLGNQFLDDARQAEVLIHVVDIAGTTDIQGQPVPAGTHDPMEDVAFVEDEFDRWFADILNREWDRITREVDQKRTRLADGITRRFTGLGVSERHTQDTLQGMNLTSTNPKQWKESDIAEFAGRLRRATKPMIIAANKADLRRDPDIPDDMIPCSAEAELLLRRAAKAGMIRYAPGDHTFEVSDDTMAPPQKKALNMVESILEKIGDTGIQRTLNTAVFDTLGMIVIYPVEDETRLSRKDGAILPDARLLPPGSTARDLAETIHADIARGFLHAIDCKTKQRIGGDKQLSDGDVIKVVSTGSRG